MKRWSLLFVPVLVGIGAGGYFVGTASHGQITPPAPLRADRLGFRSAECPRLRRFP